VLTRFVLYGLFGWCTEVVFTALANLVKSVRRRAPVETHLRGHTYLWMLPVYGAGGLAFEIGHRAMADWSWPARGMVYMAGCFAVEYAAGWVIERVTGAVPWDYRASRWSVRGYIRLDYGLLWFGFGMLLERFVRAAAPLV
jgi:uncharacterized membrane protein